MALKTKSKTWVDDEAVYAADINQNFDDIYNEFNGSITADNLAANAVTTAKIANDSVTSAKVALGYAIYNDKKTSDFSTTSASYVDVTGANCSITTTGGDILVQVAASIAVTARTCLVGVKVNSVDYDVIITNSTAPTTRMGVVKITGLPAGTYTVQMRIKVQQAGDFMVMDAYETMSIIAQEV